MRLTKREKLIIEQIYSEICSDFTTPIKISSLAARYDLEEKRFCFLFKQFYGITPYRHYLQCAMDYASSKLTTGSQVKAVAYELGYASTASFSRAFKRYNNLSPSAVLNEYLLMFILGKLSLSISVSILECLVENIRLV